MDHPLEDEWRNFELYEKIRVRERRQRFWTITLAAFLFLALCSVPVIQDRLPKWQSLDAALEISLEIEHLKTRAIQEKRSAWLRFSGPGEFRVDFVSDCESKADPVVEKVSRWKDREVPSRCLFARSFHAIPSHLGWMRSVLTLFTD